MKDTFQIRSKDGLETVKGHSIGLIGIDDRYKLTEKGNYWHLTHIPTGYALLANSNCSGYDPRDLAVLCKAIARKHKGEIF